MTTSPWDPIAEAREHWRNAGWESAADGMAAVTSVMRVQQILLSRIDAVLKPFGLTFARFEMLRLLAFAREHRVPMSRARDVLQVHPASVTSVVDRLEKDRLVTRSANPADGRSYLIQLTDDGLRLVEEATAALNEQVFTQLGFSDEELRTLTGLLAVFRRRNGDFGDQPTPPEAL